MKRTVILSISAINLRPSPVLGRLTIPSGVCFPASLTPSGCLAWSWSSLVHRSLDPTLVSIGEQGARFKSYFDCSIKSLTPENSIQIQRQLGADLVIVLGISFFFCQVNVVGVFCCVFQLLCRGGMYCMYIHVIGVAAGAGGGTCCLPLTGNGFPWVCVFRFFPVFFYCIFFCEGGRDLWRAGGMFRRASRCVWPLLERARVVLLFLASDDELTYVASENRTHWTLFPPHCTLSRFSAVRTNASLLMVLT